jgi:hypothetical protein
MGASLISPSAATTAASGISNFTGADSNDQLKKANNGISLFQPLGLPNPGIPN